MPRRSRITENGYYHVINRGVEKRKIFLDNDDHHKFINLLDAYRAKYDFVLHAFCLMNNHYHLLIEIKHRNLSEILQKINFLYSRYFNKKYQRVGHLWQGRFKSEDGIFRVIYVVKYLDLVHVLHAFQKKAQQSSNGDLELAKKQLIQLIQEIS